MTDNALTVSTTVAADAKATWHYYTEAEHVINWNFASEDWHCPKAVNDLRVGGEFIVTMAAKDGDMSFDLEGTYDEVNAPKHIAYTLTNGRKVSVDFQENGAETEVTVQFEPEGDNSGKEQTDNWQGILDNFKKYVRTLEKA